MEQEMKFDNYNTVDYAMYRHDIERIEEVDISDVNEKLAIGWKLLYIGTQAGAGFPFDGDQSSWFAAIMGVPRQKECLYHSGYVQEYHLQSDEWYCPECRKKFKERNK